MPDIRKRQEIRDVVFADNVSGNITASSMRTFVDSIYTTTPIYVEEYLTANAVASASATDWHHAISAAIVDVSAQVVSTANRGTTTIRHVVLPQRIMRVDKALTFPTNLKITGQGNFGGTILDFENCTAQTTGAVNFSFDANNFHHGTWLEDFSIRNAPRNGFYVSGNTGEDFHWDNIQANGCGENGFHFDAGAGGGTTSQKFGRMQAFSNGAAGLFCKTAWNRSAFGVTHFSGDNNEKALIHVRSGDRSGTFTVDNWKTEIRVSATPSAHAVLVCAGNGGTVHLGAGFVFTFSENVTSKVAAIENRAKTGGVTAHLTWDHIGFVRDDTVAWDASASPAYRQVATANTITVPKEHLENSRFKTGSTMWVRHPDNDDADHRNRFMQFESEQRSWIYSSAGPTSAFSGSLGSMMIHAEASARAHKYYIQDFAASASGIASGWSGVMTENQMVKTGTDDPTNSPDFIGQMYINTSGPAIFIGVNASATVSASGWVRTSAA